MPWRIAREGSAVPGQGDGLKKREVPALDDAFVQDLGGEPKTVSDLRAKIRSEMEQQKKDRADSDQREAVLTALAEKNPIEAPPALVERNVDAMLQGMLEGFMPPRHRPAPARAQPGPHARRAASACAARSERLSAARGHRGEGEDRASEEDLAKHFDKLAGELKAAGGEVSRGVQAARSPSTA